MERVKSDQPDIVKAALEMLKTEIRSSTSSMTAVPKPLKFLRTHRTDLVETHARMTAGPNKVRTLQLISHSFSSKPSLHDEHEGCIWSFLSSSSILYLLSGPSVLTLLLFDTATSCGYHFSAEHDDRKQDARNVEIQVDGY